MMFWFFVFAGSLLLGVVVVAAVRLVWMLHAAHCLSWANACVVIKTWCQDAWGRWFFPRDDESWKLHVEQDTLFRPYVGDEVQGFHRGQLEPSEHSNDDLWSQVVDAFAAETRKMLREKYPKPPQPSRQVELTAGKPPLDFLVAEVDSAFAQWWDACNAIDATIDAEFTRIMAEKYPPEVHLS